MAKTIEPTVTPEEHDEIVDVHRQWIESIQWAGTSGNKQEDDN